MADREMMEAAQALLDLCVRKKLTLGLAESCTGGMLAAALTEISGSSRVLDRGYVTYSNEAKQQIGVAAATIERYGAVSRETAEAMAKGVLANAPVTLSASVTGIAGPDGGTREKPVGLVHFAVAASRSGKLIHHEHRFGAIGRAQVRRASVLRALTMLTELAEGEDFTN
jgi:nicotinamide-nucleotide amidase